MLMRNIYFLAGLILLGFSSLNAQTILQFTINQSPLLIADAGSDRVILTGTSTTLGGAPSASGGSGVYTYLWTPAEGLSQTNISNPVASPSKTTKYTVSVSDGKKCIITSSTVITVSSTLGVSEVKDEIGLLIYPNPNNGSFLITSEKSLSSGPVLIEVFNALGSLIYSESIPDGHQLNKTVTLSHKSSGMYFVRLSGNDLNVSKAIMIH